MNTEIVTTETVTSPAGAGDSLATLRYLNETAVREYALACSKSFRAGRFSRVGEDFLAEVKADVEAFIRKLRAQYITSPHDPLYESDEIQAAVDFVTGALVEKLKPELNKLVARIIQNKVQRQPSRGVTLGATY